MISRMRILIHPRWWLTKLFSLLQPYGLFFMSQGGCLSCGRSGASFIRPGGDGGFRRSSPLAWVPSLFGSQCRLHPPSPPGLASVIAGGGHVNAYLSCVKRPDLLTTSRFFSTMCVENVLVRTGGDRRGQNSNSPVRYHLDIRVETQPKRPRFHSIIIKG